MRVRVRASRLIIDTVAVLYFATHPHRIVSVPIGGGQGHDRARSLARFATSDVIKCGVRMVCPNGMDDRRWWEDGGVER